MPGLALSEWGPGAWNTLHAFAHTAPETIPPDERRQFREFLREFGRRIPCPKCRKHFLDFLDRRASTDEVFATRASVVALLNDAHNEVNARRGTHIFTLEEHYRVYDGRPRRGRDAALVQGAAVAAIVALVATNLLRPRRRVSVVAR